LRVKVIDFGTAFLKQGEGKIDLSTGCGTIDFMAPEILEGKSYDAKCDMWSIGVIAFFLICGLPPFLGVDDKAIARKIFQCDYDFDHENWNEISNEAKEWIKNLIVPESAERFDPDQALDNEWLKECTDPTAKGRRGYKIHPFVLLNIRSCNEPKRLHHVMLNHFS